VIAAASVRHETRLFVSFQCIIFYSIQFDIFEMASFGLQSQVTRKNLAVNRTSTGETENTIFWISSFCRLHV